MVRQGVLAGARVGSARQVREVVLTRASGDRYELQHLLRFDDKLLNQRDHENAAAANRQLVDLFGTR